MKKDKTIYWIATGIIALFILLGVFFINSAAAIESMHHLGLPEWFRWELSIGNIIGALILILPIKGRLKEWAYVALGIDYISAFIAHLSVDGFVPMVFAPIIVFGVLLISYIYYHKITDNKSTIVQA